LTQAWHASYRVGVQSRALLLSIWLALAWLGSCQTGRLPGPHAAADGCSRGPIPVSSVPASSSGPASAPSASALPYEFDQGCAGLVDTRLAASMQVDRLEESCVRGFDRIEGVALRPGDAGLEAELRLDAHACVRFGIAREAPGDGVEVWLEDTRGMVMVHQAGRTPMLVARGGPTCVRDAGAYRVRLRSLGSGGGEVRLAAWKAR